MQQYRKYIYAVITVTLNYTYKKLGKEYSKMTLVGILK